MTHGMAKGKKEKKKKRMSPAKRDKAGEGWRHTQGPRGARKPTSSGSQGELSGVEYSVEGKSGGEEGGEVITGPIRESGPSQGP